MKKNIEKGILQPKPIKGFSKKRIVYFPLDAPSQSILGLIKQSALKEIQSIFGDFYLLKDKIILYKSLGAPSAVLSLEPLIVSGAKEIIIIGYCGSLHPDYRMMDAISISKAFSEEGTSRHYFPRKRIFHPSSELKKRLENILETSNLHFLSGSVVSTDAPFRETRSWLKEKQKREIGLVDMEVSAVFALAQFYGIQATALLIVSDEIWSGVWKIAFKGSEFEQKIKDYFIPVIKQI